MGEMTVKGYAERKVECDLVKYTFNFEKVGYSIDTSIKAVSAELERFLEIIEKKTGIAPNVFRIENNSTSKEYHSNKEKRYEADRKISA
ncbi:MAG: SIMPL domain-containing protein, partial [Ruminococcus sp.]|nr:SIMPL domain-containing protein [Ruminococcus sp.]